LPSPRHVGASRSELETLYQDRYPGFRRALATVTGSYESAHDVVQEAFARALVQRRAFRGDGPLGAWVWAIALRLAWEENERVGRFSFDELPDLGLADPARDPDLEDALRALPPRRRLVFFLRYFAGASYEEIAVACGLSAGTVAATLAQARASIAAALREEVRE
jgi:RNA polymerase sigma-70 factor, ECF subfamily